MFDYESRQSGFLKRLFFGKSDDGIIDRRIKRDLIGPAVVAIVCIHPPRVAGSQAKTVQKTKHVVFP